MRSLGPLKSHDGGVNSVVADCRRNQSLDRRVRPTSARAPTASRCRRSRPSDRRVVFHRYYDPATGQFLSVDPLVVLTGTPYAYANDDAVNSDDPSGEDVVDWVFAFLQLWSQLHWLDPRIPGPSDTGQRDPIPQIEKVEKSKSSNRPPNNKSSNRDDDDPCDVAFFTGGGSGGYQLLGCGNEGNFGTGGDDDEPGNDAIDPGDFISPLAFAYSTCPSDRTQWV